jgi:hypothetical protein
MRIARSTSEKLDKLLLFGLTANVIVAFGTYFYQSSTKAAKEQEREDRLLAARDARLKADIQEEK